MSIEWIRVRARAQVVRKEKDKAEVPITGDDALSIAQQIGVDAVYGSFQEFRSSYWDSRWDAPLSQLVRAEGSLVDGSPGTMELVMLLASRLYPPQHGGVQHLIGVLTGDLFNFTMPRYTFTPFKVEELTLPPSMVEGLRQTYRQGRAHSIHEIRKAFALEDGQPLLAFSFKPRYGLTLAAVQDIAVGVLEAGFHLVEMDTRSVTADPIAFKRLCDIAERAAAVGRNGRVTRFSPNLSVSAPKALKLYDDFQKTSPPPYVVKVDGGLDGISTVQSIRDSAGEHQPIITCYPLLRDQLAPRFPKDSFVDVLAMSGVDVIYPGGRPDVGTGRRKLGAAEQSELKSAVLRYRRLSARGWPMITVAGGVYPGQLHALYELVGPDVAFFLGGGVALHKDGPVEGARLCVDVLKRAVDQRNRRPSGAAVSDLPDKLIERVEDAILPAAGEDPGTYAYVRPHTSVFSLIDIPHD